MAVAAALLLCTTAALPDVPALAAGKPAPYAFAPDARPVTGAPSAAAAEPLTPGATYKSSLPGEGEVHYRLDLDDASDAYVSVTAVPPPDSTVQARDGIDVSVRDATGRPCSQDNEIFGAGHSPRPIGAWGAREISPDQSRCRSAGAYDVIVERVTTADSTPDTWVLELFVTSEPPRRQTGATSAPETWDSASPTLPSGESQRRQGGSGFASAAPVGEGVWTTDVQPGRTLFYKVPLDWGRQLYATAELGTSSGAGGSAAGALNLALYNPARALVDDASANYNGTRKPAALDPLPPVAYENRYAALDRLSAMRFAGSYYLVVHLSAAVAESYGNGPFELTLRVRVGGTAQAGPAYAGESEPAGVFEVDAGDREAAAVGGAGGGGDGGDAAMTLLAVGGIGAGTLVLVVLGVWMVVARRRVGVG
ncbi:hypothetical protein ABT384_15895 [Streptomyces lanatus]|uniref:Uncharacterized protein n=1 Tax=Streptomyces lanatus TaxID=66900 RepID=A0ABV1XR96_9ACTN|nr:hypothetical protein [Streptomyces lanatus]GHH05420.1 hypothetical protein GCM10018780_36920 [Streptomyces lanatus]